MKHRWTPKSAVARSRRQVNGAVERLRVVALEWEDVDQSFSYHTCDAPLCDTCTRSPAPNKDLCPRHWKIWEEHPENPANKEQAQ